MVPSATTMHIARRSHLYDRQLVNSVFRNPLRPTGWERTLTAGVRSVRVVPNARVRFGSV